MPVYVLKAGDTDMVKIGWTDDIEARVRDLQCAHWEVLKVIRTIDGFPWVERAMHRKFSAQRVLGEWFRFDQEMLTVEVSDLSPTVEAHPHLPIIIALGGVRSLATAISVKPGQAIHWGHRGIPAKYWHRVVERAAERGLPLTTEELAQKQKAAP